jgi:hypothetical protein
VEAANTPPKMLPHFHRAWAVQGSPINVLRDERVMGRPSRQKAPRRLTDCKEELVYEKSGLWDFSLFFPAESDAPGTKINSRI